ncbi:MAG TPA: glucosyl-3-phosphoglycerate synthase [Anaerolineales bacterium]|jgi:glucosyl-3-phosphoglycerate synthase
MAATGSAKLLQKVLVPFVEGCEGIASLRAAAAIADAANIVVVGIVPVPGKDALSKAVLPARAMRKALRDRRSQQGLRILEDIHVSENPWKELIKIVQDEEPGLLVLEAAHMQAFGISMGTALRNPPCNVAIACGQIPERVRKLLLPLRGGPSAELTLRLGLAIARKNKAAMHTLHLLPRDAAQARDLPYRGIERVLRNLPEVKDRLLRTDDPAEAILSASSKHDLLIMGASTLPLDTTVGLGPIAEMIIEKRAKGTLIVKIHHPGIEDMGTTFIGKNAISILVDKWFAENTYHADEFQDLDSLLALKKNLGVTVSVALPSLNEQATVGKVIRTIKGALMDKVPLLDEIVLIDSDSSDRTRAIAAGLGVPVHIHQQTLSSHGVRAGKGEALWKSLYLTRGDIILWIDTDIVNIHPRFIYGLLGPLLLSPDVQFVKGYYQRPLKVNGKMQASGGGRVTELTARPLLNLFYPELSGVIQPLSGEYGGRRSLLERLPFSSGYGVEIGLLIDTLDRSGLRAIAQVDLLERIHHNQPLESLSKMSFAIIQTVVRRLERRYKRNILEDVNKTMKLIRSERGSLSLDVTEIAELERPAMMELPEYRATFNTKPARKYPSRA